MSVLPSVQKAITLHQLGGVIEDLREETIPTPSIERSFDLLVRVHAFALNPVDYKVRKNSKGGGGVKRLDQPRILGWDAAGEVVGVGSEVQGFNLGDNVYYAGDITRPGSYQQYQLVDYRIVGHRPVSLDWEDAAALPLCSLTAWESLQELCQVEKGKTILIIAGAGGVGSIGIQLAKHWGLNVIATASRPDSIDWVKSMGADIVINHDLTKEFKRLSLPPVDYVLNTYSDHYLPSISEIIAPFGHVVSINGDLGSEDISAFKSFFDKRVHFHSEIMFGRIIYNVKPEKQGEILEEVARLVDAKLLKTTANCRFTWQMIHNAHRMLEGRSTIGKIVVTIDDNTD